MDRRLLILWLTIFIDLIGFTLFIPVVPYFGGAMGASECGGDAFRGGLLHPGLHLFAHLGR